MSDFSGILTNTVNQMTVLVSFMGIELITFAGQRRKRKISIRNVGKAMRDEYDIENLNPRKNPYSNRVKKQITINIDGEIIDYFKSQSESLGIPYQTLINLYLSDCVASKRKLKMEWR